MLIWKPLKCMPNYAQALGMYLDKCMQKDFMAFFQFDTRLLTCNEYHQHTLLTAALEQSLGITIESWLLQTSNLFYLFLKYNIAPFEIQFSDEFQEPYGSNRINQALHAHNWPNLEMKGNSLPKEFHIWIFLTFSLHSKNAVTLKCGNINPLVYDRTSKGLKRMVST